MIDDADKKARDRKINFQEELSRRLEEIGSAPILFVGAGLSKRYLNLPDWSGLIEKLANLTNKDISYYRVRADGDLARMSSLLCEAFNEVIDKDIHKEFKASHIAELQKVDSALKLFAAEEIKKASHKTDDEMLLEELEAFKSVVVDAVITTNFDTMLEEIFPEYELFVGQDQLVFSKTQGVGEIYKIHGTVDDANSLILTEEDYNDFNDRNSYLAAKLLTMFAEHPIIFLGYSMNDPNILQILESLVRCLKPEHIGKLQHRLIFVQRAKGGNDYQISDTLTTVGGVSIPVVTVYVPDEFKSLFEVLGNLERKLPAKTLRLIKDKIYDLVLNNDPHSQILVTNIEDNSKIEFVMGVGAISQVGIEGYKRVRRERVVADTLHDESLDSKQMVLSAFPDLLSLPGNFPMIKHLVKAGYIDDSGNLKNKEQLDDKIIARFEKGIEPYLATSSSRQRARQKISGITSVDELFSKLDTPDFLAYVGALDRKYLDPDQLLARLIEIEDEYMTDFKNPKISNYVKAVCLYDWLKYMPTGVTEKVT